jgi:hypothetical protein
MAAKLRTFLVSLLVCEAVLAAAIAIMHLLAGTKSLGPEGRRYIDFAFALGVVVALACWPVCRLLHRVSGTLAGLVVGLATAVAAGWIWALIIDHWINVRIHYWTPLDAWVEGLQLSIPSGIAGAIIGFLQSRAAAAHAGSHSPSNQLSS